MLFLACMHAILFSRFYVEAGSFSQHSWANGGPSTWFP